MDSELWLYLSGIPETGNDSSLQDSQYSANSGSLVSTWNLISLLYMYVTIIIKEEEVMNLGVGGLTLKELEGEMIGVRAMY